ncbi:MAG: alpha-amylase [Bacteroidetes bacterium]|nr:alpha-amylase [Bacteroidota bacterium]
MNEKIKAANYKIFHRLIHIVVILLAVLIIISCGEDGTSSSNEDNTNNPNDNNPSTEDIVMYEINFRAFSESGDFKGVTNKLDHIKSLGVNVIWLMPIHPIGVKNSVNSPYSVKNYKDVNPEFGSTEDLRNLINESHKKDMSVIIDWVANHTAWDNPWIANKDWYTRNAAGDIIIPPGTNWQDVADLNYDDKNMRLAMIDAMKYWVTEFSIDGFRCDAADFVPYSFWTQAIDTLENIKGRRLILLAEGSRIDHFTAGFQMNYSWDFFNKLKDVYLNMYSAENLFTVHAQEYKNIAKGKHKLRFTTNHDESAWNGTPIELFGGIKSSFSAFVISTYLGGVPLVYGSQEVGTQNKISFFGKNPINWATNPELLKEYQLILSIYKKIDALRKGTLESFPNNDILAFKKVSGSEEVLIFVNVRGKSISYELPSALQNTNWKNELNGETISLKTALNFDAFEYFVFTK